MKAIAASPTRKLRQLQLTPRTWGGFRPGAGRKPAKRRKAPHRARPPLASRHPVHVTMKVAEGIPTLRGRCCGPTVARAIRTASERHGFRLIHFCVLANHIHLICEAKDRDHLARGIQGFAIRIALGINQRLDRQGTVFAQRYHRRTLRTPMEVKRALLYVINNQARHHRRHNKTARQPLRADRWSSGPYFTGWTELPTNACRPPPWWPRARTWLLRQGWQLHGPLELGATPGRATG